MNLPNKITIFRVCMIPVFLFFYLQSAFDQQLGQTIALVIFGIASASDALDGYIARSRNLITNFGKLMDPLADKLLVTAALIAMVQTGILPAWVVVILVSREFFISGYRQLALERGVVMAASYWAKFKTATQMVMIVFLLLPLPLTVTALVPMIVFKWLLIIASVVLSVVSAVEYVYKQESAKGHTV